MPIISCTIPELAEVAKRKSGEILVHIDTIVELSERALKAEKQIEEGLEIIHALDNIEMLPAFKKAADESGLSFRDWVIDKLTEAIDPNTSNLPIRRDIYERYASIAHRRGCSIDVLGKGGTMSDWLTKAIDNGRV